MTEDQEIENINKKTIIARVEVFNLNDFYLKFLPDKYCEIAVNLKRNNRQFTPNDFVTTSDNLTISIFQV